MDEVVGTDAAEFEDNGKKKASGGDPEIVAMGRIAKTLDGLQPLARDRVVQWLYSRYIDLDRELVERTRGPGLG